MGCLAYLFVPLLVGFAGSVVAIVTKFVRWPVLVLTVVAVLILPQQLSHLSTDAHRPLAGPVSVRAPRQAASPTASCR